MFLPIFELDEIHKVEVNQLNTDFHVNAAVAVQLLPTLSSRRKLFHFVYNQIVKFDVPVEEIEFV